MSSGTQPWRGARPATRGDEVCDDSLVEQALTLLARTQCGDPVREGEAKEALRRWQAQSAVHGQAAAQAARHWARADDVARTLGTEASDVASPGDAPERLLARIDASGRARASRRRAARAIASGGTALALLLALGWAWLSAPVFDQTLAAVHGQQLKDARLPDGTVLDLDADTQVQLRYTQQGREAALTHGRIRFDVAREQRQGWLHGSLLPLLPVTRPFVVHTPAGRVEVLGTAFTVSDRGGVLHVVVERGLVRVTAGGRATAAGAAVESVELRVDEAVRIEADGSLGPVERADGADAASWKQGWLAFEATTLAEAVAQFDVYRRRGGAGDAAGAPAIDVSPQAAGLRITGRFRANDPRAFVAALPGVLPVRVDSVPGDAGRLRIERRAERK